MICEHYSAHNLWKVYLVSIKISWNENSFSILNYLIWEVENLSENSQNVAWSFSLISNSEYCIFDRYLFVHATDYTLRKWVLHSFCHHLSWISIQRKWWEKRTGNVYLNVGTQDWNYDLVITTIDCKCFLQQAQMDS